MPIKIVVDARTYNLKRETVHLSDRISPTDELRSALKEPEARVARKKVVKYPLFKPDRPHFRVEVSTDANGCLRLGGSRSERPCCSSSHDRSANPHR